MKSASQSAVTLFTSRKFNEAEVVKKMYAKNNVQLQIIALTGMHLGR